MNLPLNEQNIIGLLGLQNLSDEQKAGMVSRITDLVEKRLLVRVFDALTPPQRNEFESLLEKQDQAAIAAFLDAQVPDLAQWAEQEATRAKQELLDWAHDITGE